MEDKIIENKKIDANVAEEVKENDNKAATAEENVQIYLLSFIDNVNRYVEMVINKIKQLYNKIVISIKEMIYGKSEDCAI